MGNREQVELAAEPPQEDELDDMIEDEIEFARRVESIRQHNSQIGAPAHGQVCDFEYDEADNSLTIELVMPDGESDEVTFEHGKRHLSDDLDTFLNYVGTTHLLDIVGADIPVIYTDDGWKVHLPRAPVRFSLMRQALDTGLAQLEEDELNYRNNDYYVKTNDDRFMMTCFACFAISLLPAVLFPVLLYPILLIYAGLSPFIISPGQYETTIL